MINLAHHFRYERNSHSDWERRQQWFIKARQDQEKRTDRAERVENDDLAAGIELIAATDQQIRDFEVKLDQYDTATVTALMENQKQLDEVNARIEYMLSQAYVMEDGRRVFKTEDGTQVFDEFGEEVTRDELDFDLISPDAPKAEHYLQERSSRIHLEERREVLLEYQEKIDNNREHLAKGGLTENDLEEMEADLADIPEEVMAQMPGYEKPDISAQANVDIETTVTTTSPAAALSVPQMN